MPTGEKLALALVIALAAASLAGFLGWLWQRPVAGGPRWLALSVVAAFLVLPVFHLLMSWYLALRFERRPSPPPPPGLTVDVFVTATDEPLEMVEATLRAALAMRGEHRTYLLDDTGRAELERLAGELGAGYLAREGNRGFKAGNVNHALERTDGEVVAIFDVDHRPERDFLERTLGHFRDPEVGFVQVMLSFSNRDESPVARAAAQICFEYHNVVAVGKDRCGGASLMGSNAVIRRRALEEVGRYRAGLAEDLETSLALHAGGWRSAYVGEPLAPGLAPADLTAFFKQQLKWSHGVLEAFLGSLGGSFFRLAPQQRLCYLVRFTNYLFGVLVFANLAVVALALFRPFFDFETLIWKSLPLTATALVARLLPLRLWAVEPEARRGFYFKGYSLFLSAWPIYTLAALSSLLRFKLPFLATPKTPSHRLRPWTIAPQLAMLGLLAAGLLWRVAHWQAEPLPLTAAMALFLIASHWMLFVAIWKGLREGRRESAHRPRHRPLERPAIYPQPD